MFSRGCFFSIVCLQFLLTASIYSQPAGRCPQEEESCCEEPRRRVPCRRQCERSKSYEDSYVHEIDEFNNQEYDTAWPGKNEDSFYDSFTR